jgi:hypothetical protein
MQQSSLKKKKKKEKKKRKNLSCETLLECGKVKQLMICRLLQGQQRDILFKHISKDRLFLFILFDSGSKQLLLNGLDAPENNRFAAFHELAGGEHFVENLVDFVEIKHQIQLAHIAKVGVQHLDKQVNRFQISTIIIVKK